MSGHPLSSSQQDKLLEEAQKFWLQWVEAAFPDLDSRSYFLPPVHFNRVPMSRLSIIGGVVLILCDAPGQAGRSIPGQAGQLSPGETGPSNQPTITAAHPTDPQPKAGQNVLDVPSPPKKPGKVERLAARFRRLFSTSTTETTLGEAAPSNQPKTTAAHSTDTQSKSGQNVPNVQSPPKKAGNFKSDTSIQDSDVRDDAASQRILCCLQKMAEVNGEVLVGLSQLQFGQYLGEPCYAAAAAQLPVPANLPSVLPQNWKEGDFDVLLIHRHYGLVVCEVKAFGDNVKELNMSQQDIDNNIRKKLKQAMSQLDKAEAMLSHLVSDVTPGLRITKTIAVPNLMAHQVQQAISGDTLLTQELCRCLGTTDPADIPALCLCSDQLSDPKTAWELSSDVLMELGYWWQRRVTVSLPDDRMTCDVYKTLVARFCGPATAVTVPCTSPPRLCVKTLGQAVSWTGECYTAQITLFPEQVDLLNTAPPRLFVAGPPGTGKSVVLLLMATEWMRRGNDIDIVSTWSGSRAACSMMYYLLLHTVNTHLTLVISPGQPRLLEFELYKENGVEQAVNELSNAAKKGSLFVIADEAVKSEKFKTFCDKLMTQVPELHLWAASCYHGDAPTGWQVEYLTRPLRSPPVVVREVQQDWQIIKKRKVQAYSERGVPDHTDGPPVSRLYHRGQGHSGDGPHDCVTCGREVASFLHSLRVPGTVASGQPLMVPTHNQKRRKGNKTTSATVTTTSGCTTPPGLQWRDVLVLYRYLFHDVSKRSGMVMGLRKAGIPARVMKDDDTEDVARARSDVVWVADGDSLRGLERKVVVSLNTNTADFYTVRLHYMSRCTSQLVIVSP